MEIEGECPACSGEVAYDEWQPAGAEGVMRCPLCGEDVDVDEVFPEANE